MTTLTLSSGNDNFIPPSRAHNTCTNTDTASKSDLLACSNPLDEFLANSEYKAFKIALYALRDEQAALDVVQDAMLKLSEKYSDRPQAEWPALFFTILNNRITDVRRWRKLREFGGKSISIFRSREDGEENLLESGLGVETNPPQHQPEQALLAKQLKKHIERALEYLSEKQRQVFMLREWQGMSVRDTATVLGCSEGSVKQHHFRAMRGLRKNLGEVWDHD